jgi:AcrR family transcriptional regulator
MGRPRVHDEQARVTLLRAAENLAAMGGLEAVGVRSAAAAAGTTTRAVYTVFGSKEELVEGLAERAMELLHERVAAVPLTDDPVRNLVECAVLGYRCFALEHPELFRLFFNGNNPAWRLSASSRAAAKDSYGQLLSLVRAARATGFGSQYSTGELAVIWDAMCSGLALREICGGIDPARAEKIWRDSLGALVTGLNHTT